LGASLDRPNICILTEFMCKGNLSYVLKSEKDLSWAIKVKMALDAAEGMAYLHSCKPPVVHRDLKSLNLLVDEGYNVKVADFGLSKATSGDSLNSKVGSLNWCAPEILLRSSPFTPAGDVYSFGMVLWELTTHTAPFHGMHPLQIVRAIDQNDLPDIPEDTDSEYTQLIKDCWHSDARRRPTFITISQRLAEIEKRMREEKK
jgi:serine/threonine protein kinase